LVAQLVDLTTGEVRGVRSALNPQAVFGADVMSRVEFALTPDGRERLKQEVRNAIGTLIAKLRPGHDLRKVIVAGNTVMHHLFCGIDVTPLSHFPFEPVDDGEQSFTAAELGWTALGEVPVRFLGCLGGFVGSDILAGIFATRLYQSEELTGLIDLGTNGEMVFGTRERLVCASTAAGPAFEGGRIRMGMRAATGAIASVTRRDGGLVYEVLGGGEPRGICGSGLVDAVAHLLDGAAILPNGRLGAGARSIPLCGEVSLIQADVRELQLAKGAIAAGIQILLERLGATPADVSRVYLAGAFGNYINRASARRIGLLPFPEEKIEPAGNTSLLGAKMALFAGRDLSALTAITGHVSLAEDPEFQEKYVEWMRFPRSDEFGNS
ncbi:MAG: ASKHA domain-containing protein, partial [Acidobacteria bacterium]|nr:ASKHA domain-containing protein [Acidobacteriota bacterium]